jgi:hypothetical protein
MSADAFEEKVARYSAEVRSLARETRALVLELLPAAEETVDPSSSVVGYGYGPGYKGLICSLILSREGVKMGLTQGAGLPDPKGLLQGVGKVHRYIPIETPSDLRKPGLRQLVGAAAAAWRERNPRP